MDNMNVEIVAAEAAVEAPIDEAVETEIEESGIKLIPFEEGTVDFDTFCKSDFRVVKVKDCVAVPKSK